MIENSLILYDNDTSQWTVIIFLSLSDMLDNDKNKNSDCDY